MKKHKNKTIAAVVIVGVLVCAWFYGGNYNKDQGSGTAANAELRMQNAELDYEGGTRISSGHTQVATEGDVSAVGVAPAPDSSATTEPLKPSEPAGSTEPSEAPETESLVQSVASVKELSAHGQSANVEEQPASTQSASEALPEQNEPGSGNAMDIKPDTGMDKYPATPVPEGKPAPVEPESMVVGDGSFTVYLTIRCDTILDNMNLLNKEKHELVPEDGVIFHTTAVTAFEGESVFNVLQRETRRIRLHMTFRNTPIYNSAYIEAINNLYEFDVGELSGWIYKVNDWFPNYGCSRYLLKAGDEIEWHYTCDLGHDLGEHSLGGQWYE